MLSRSHSSVNAMPGDGRTIRAREAGEILFRNSRSDSNITSMSNSRSYGTISTEGYPGSNTRMCCGPMFPVRRTFCLILVFDLIVSAVFYFIYTRVLNFQKSDYYHEVKFYDFETSLFDTVLMSAWRVAPLLLAYALFRLSHPWPVAVTTTLTCVYVILKVFLFQWSPMNKDDPDAMDHNNVICYALLVVSFVMAWIETWFLDFQVLPIEYKERQKRLHPLPESERNPLLAGLDQRFDTEQDVFASLPHSRDDSGDESQSPPFRSLTSSRHHSRQPSRGSSSGFSLGGNEQEYLQIAKECWDKAWEMYEDKSGWKVEKGAGLDDGQVSVKNYPGMGRVFKLEAYVDCSVQELFNELVVYTEETPKWNPTVTESKIIQVIDDCTDIQYTVAAEAAGGLVASRDFVNLRHWKTHKDVILSSGCGVCHAEAPENKKHVRGHNRPGGWFLKPVAGNPKRCIFCWIMNTDIKGWLPQWTVDQALSGTLVNFLHHVRTRVAGKKRPGAVQV